jgi:hypothetical protein
LLSQVTLTISTVFNYIDPGSGSVVIQMIIGALIGVGVTLKLYWERLKQKFTSKFSKSNDV